MSKEQERTETMKGDIHKVETAEEAADQILFSEEGDVILFDEAGDPIKTKRAYGIGERLVKKTPRKMNRDIERLREQLEKKYDV